MRTESIVAALLFDIPTLKRLGVEARPFIDAMSVPSWNTDKWGNSSLATAARGIVLARSGALEEALPQFAALQESTEEKLLGACLTGCFAGASDAEPALEHALRLTGSLDDPELRSRILLKIAALARDSNVQSVERDAIRLCLECAPPGSRLLRVARMTAVDLGALDIEEALDTPLGPYDPLLAAPWISEEALMAAASIAKDRMYRDLRSAWSSQWHIGATPADELAAAELQYTWIGRHDMRSLVRKQVGAALLTRYAGHSNDWTYGLWAWVEGDGQNIATAVRTAEPHIANEQVLEILDALATAGPRRRERLLETTMAFWHRLPDERIAPTLAQFPLSEQLPRPDVRNRLWAKLLERSPVTVLAALAGEPDERVVAVLRELAVWRIRRLDQTARDVLLDLASGLEGADTEVIGLVAVLTLDRGDTRAAEVRVAEVIDITPFPQAQALKVLESAPEALAPSLVARLFEAQLTSVRGLLTEAQGGIHSYTSGSVLIDLAEVAARTPQPQIAVELLLQVCESHHTSIQQRLEARQALSLLSPLDADAAQRLRQLPDDGPRDLTEEDLTPAVLRAARISALTPELTTHERLGVLADARGKEARARLLSMHNLVGLLEGGADEGAEWALVGGLFDPSDDVVRVAVGAIGDGKVRSEGPLLVGVDRIARLFDERAADMRATVAWAAHRLSSERSAPMKSLLVKATDDPSWIVREAVLGN